MCVISSIVILSRVSSDLGVAAPLALFMLDLVVEHNGLDEGYHSSLPPLQTIALYRCHTSDSVCHVSSAQQWEGSEGTDAHFLTRYSPRACQSSPVSAQLA